jgi:hypothetical protein
MAEYRADIVGLDGQLIRSIEIISPNDEIAKEHAKHLVEEHDVELWKGDRRIAKFDHKPIAVSPAQKGFIKRN